MVVHRGVLSREAGSLQLLKDRIDKGQVSPKVRLFHQLEVDRLEGCGTAGSMPRGRTRRQELGAGAQVCRRRRRAVVQVPLHRLVQFVTVLPEPAQREHERLLLNARRAVSSARAVCGGGGMRPLRCRPSEPQSRALLALLRRVGAADAAERLGPAIVADLAYTAAIQVAQDWLRRDDLTPAMCAFRPQAAGTAAIDVVQVSADFDGMSPPAVQKKAFYYKVWSRLSPPNRAWLVMTAT